MNLLYFLNILAFYSWAKCEDITSTGENSMQITDQYTSETNLLQSTQNVSTEPLLLVQKINKLQRRNDRFRNRDIVFQEAPPLMTALTAAEPRGNERRVREYFLKRPKDNNSGKRRQPVSGENIAHKTKRKSSVTGGNSPRLKENSSGLDDIFGVFDQIPFSNLEDTFGAKSPSHSRVHTPVSPKFNNDVNVFKETDAIGGFPKRPHGFQTSHLGITTDLTTSTTEVLYPSVKRMSALITEPTPILGLNSFEGKNYPDYDIHAVNRFPSYPEYGYAQNIAQELPNQLYHPPVYNNYHDKIITVTNTQYKKVRYLVLSTVRNVDRRNFI